MSAQPGAARLQFGFHEATWSNMKQHEATLHESPQSSPRKSTVLHKLSMVQWCLLSNGFLTICPRRWWLWPARCQEAGAELVAFAAGPLRWPIKTDPTAAHPKSPNQEMGKQKKVISPVATEPYYRKTSVWTCLNRIPNCKWSQLFWGTPVPRLDVLLQQPAPSCFGHGV